MNSIEFSKRIVQKYSVKQKRPLFPGLVLLRYPAGFSTIIIRQKKYSYSLNFTYQLINNEKNASRLNVNNEMNLKTSQEKRSFLNVLPGFILNRAVNLPVMSKSILLFLSSLSRNALIRAFNYTNSNFEKTKEFEGRAFSSTTGPEKSFLNLFNRYSSLYQAEITTYPINNPAYPKSLFPLSSVNYFLNFARINGQMREMMTGINQRIKKYFLARWESKYRVNDGHEQSVFNKQDSLINNFRLSTIWNIGKFYKTSSLKSSGRDKYGSFNKNYGASDDHDQSVFNNRDSLIKIINFRPSAVFNIGKLYAANSKKGSGSSKSGSSNNRFGYLKATASFSIPGERTKPSGYRKKISNYAIFNLRHMDKTPGLKKNAAYPQNGYSPHYSSILPSFNSTNHPELERMTNNTKRSPQRPQSYPAVLPSLEMAVNQADRRQASVRNKIGAEETVRELITRTSVIDSPPIDVNGIAEQVYGVIMRKIRLEKERRGK